MGARLLCIGLLLIVFKVILRNSGTLALPLMTNRLLKRDVAGIEVPPPEILRFMRRFGYLEPNPNDSEALYHESAIVEAIKNIQKYGALNQTGKLDNPTLSLFSKPRCGVPDIEATPYYLRSTSGTSRRRRFVIGARTWTKRRIRYFIANWSLKIPRQQVERDISRAFSLWSTYSGLNFVRANGTDAEIIVGFGSRYHGDNYPFDGAGNILAHAYYPYEMGSWGGDVHFDEDENWKENSTDLDNGVDFYSVAVHELGHSLGLAHSSVYSSIMFPYYKGPEEMMLDYDDTLAMYEMYLNKKLEDDDYSTQNISQKSETSKEETKVVTTTERYGYGQMPAVSTTFQGDYETEAVTQRKNRRDDFTTPTTVSATWPINRAKPELSEIPNICQGNFDAVTMLNGSVHIFKQEFVWKLTERYTVRHGYPRSIYEIFPFLPAHIKHIDAAYERYDGMGVFFTGSTFWIFNGSITIEDSPRSLTDLIGSDVTLPKVDAAMMWPKNNLTYIFAGSTFWRYNDRLQLLDVGYPKSISRWSGIPGDIDAAATLTNGKTYFFKDNLYWLYNNAYVRPERGYPRRASTAWLGCKAPTKTPLRNFNTTVSFISSFASISVSMPP